MCTVDTRFSNQNEGYPIQTLLDPLDPNYHGYKDFAAEFKKNGRFDSQRYPSNLTLIN